MRIYFGAALAALAISSAAVAKDDSWYVGLDAGVLFPKSPRGGNVFADYTAVNATVPPGGVLPAIAIPAPLDTTFTDPFNFKTKTGFDADLVAGYDFGMFRVEAELGYKQS